MQLGLFLYKEFWSCSWRSVEFAWDMSDWDTVSGFLQGFVVHIWKYWFLL